MERSRLAGVLVLMLATTIASSHSLTDSQPSHRDPRAANTNTEIVINPENGTLSNVLGSLDSDTSVLLLPGTYTLDRYTPVIGKSNICLSGQGNVTITCTDNVGLVFINVMDLVLSGIRIEQCGLSGSNLTDAVTQIRRFVDLFYVVYPEMRIALLIGHSQNITIADFKVHNNTGFGLVGINVIGSSVFHQLEASNNVQPIDCTNTGETTVDEIFTNPLRYGGGVVILYQDYVSFPAADSYDLTISEGKFEQNSECSAGYLSYIRSVDTAFIRGLGNRIGGSGGLTLLLAQLNYGVNIATRDSHFENNAASFGGAGHVAIFSGVKNTEVNFQNCTFTKNGALVDGTITDRIYGGAGLGIATDLRYPDNVPSAVVTSLNSSVSITNSVFTNNTAQYGGGLYFYSAYWSAFSEITDVLRVFIDDCEFEFNIAYVGAAIEIWENKYTGGDIGTLFQITNSDVLSNVLIPHPNGSLTQSSGVVDLRNVNVSLNGNCRLENNVGTALKAEYTYVGIVGNITFHSNRGISGGALHLISFSYLIMLPNARLQIINNTALTGGGIYSDFLASSSFDTGMYSDCFLAFGYENIGPCVNCSDFNSTGISMIFADNTAFTIGPLQSGFGGQIYGSSFESCYWAIDLLISMNLPPFSVPILPLLAEKFPDLFMFFGSSFGDPHAFQTQAIRMSVNIVGEIDNTTTPYTVLPGQVFNISADTRDGFNQTITNTIRSVTSGSTATGEHASSMVGSNNFYVLQADIPTEVPVSISATENQTLEVIFYSIGQRPHTTIEVNIGTCGGVFVFDNTTNECVCVPELERFDVNCNASDQTFTIPEGRWVGLVDNTIGVADCQDGFCVRGESNRIRVVNGVPQFDDQCVMGNNSFFRRGVLCSECSNGRSFVLGSERCLECTNVSILLYILFLILGVVLTLVIYYLDITVAEGLVNGAIFFSNFVTIYGIFLFPSTFGGANYIWLVSFLSLNFGIEACLHNGMNGLERIWWQLSFPLYLFIIMIIIWIAAKYTSFLNKNPRLSVPRVFTTLMILCYVSVLQVCVQLLGYKEIETIDGGKSVRWALDGSVKYFEGAHIPMVLIAILLLVVYLIPFPFFLMFPTVISRIRFLALQKPLYDSFWNPFHPQYRFWIGLRLVFRWIPFLVSFLVNSPYNVFITNFMLIVLLYVELNLKPFKKSWVNSIDSLFIYFLVLMFTGTLFFDAETRTGNNQSQLGATIYNQILVVIAFLVMVWLFFYHLTIRFPKFKEFLLKAWARLLCKKDRYDVQENTNEPKTESETKVDPSKEQLVQTKAPTQTTIDVSQLREPLLDEGFADSVVTGRNTA